MMQPCLTSASCSIALVAVFFFFSSRRRHTRFDCDWSSDVCSSDLDLHDDRRVSGGITQEPSPEVVGPRRHGGNGIPALPVGLSGEDRKSTRLNSSHSQISYAVFCLKKKRWQEYRQESNTSLALLAS